MTVCLDTNTFLQIFGRRQPWYPILRALLDGRLTSAVSTANLLEYEEVIVRLSGPQRWRDVAALLELLSQLHGNIRFAEPQFRFNVITADPDDNKFTDCAIAAEADFVVTEDAHFAALKSAGHKPKPIDAEELIRRHLLRQPSTDHRPPMVGPGSLDLSFWTRLGPLDRTAAFPRHSINRPPKCPSPLESRLQSRFPPRVLPRYFNTRTSSSVTMPSWTISSRNGRSR